MRMNENINNKRILILNYEFPPLGGGASPVSYEISKELVKLGYNIDVVTMGFKGLPSFEVIDGINVYRVKCLRRKKEICYPWEQLSYLYSAKKFLNKHIKNNKYNICHCHFIIPTGILAWWLKKRYKLKYILTAHGSDVPGYNVDRFKFLHIFTPFFLRKICDEAKLITTPSLYLKKLIENKISNKLAKKIISLPNGSKDFYKEGLAKENIIYSCGRLLERKGYQYLIKAFNNLEVRNWKLIIIGDGPYKAELERVAKGNDKIVFTGWLDHEDEKFIDILNKAKIFALLSKSESQGIVYLEAMSAKCAIIASDVTACTETVSKEIGFLVERENFEKVSETLYSIIMDDNKLKNMMENSRKRYDKFYKWENIIEKYIKLYEI